MPRKARIDAAGALHHIIVRGIERRKIFWDDVDRDSFVKRLGQVLTETRTNCFAWALIPNHVHLLLRTGLKSAIHVARNYLGRRRNFTGQKFWARGYHVSTVGRDEKTVREYIRSQEKEDRRIDQLSLFK